MNSVFLYTGYLIANAWAKWCGDCEIKTIVMKLKAGKAILISTCVLLFTSVYTLPQEQSGRALRLIDSYGDTPCDDLKAHLDNIAAYLNNEPKSKVYILGYSGRDSPLTRVRQHLNIARPFMFYVRGVDMNRVVTINAGYREQLTIEAWLVPEGVAPPAPSSTVNPKSDARAPIKFDERYIGIYVDGVKLELSGGSECTFEEPNLEGFAEALKNAPTAKGYFILYPDAQGQFTFSSRYNQPTGSARAIIRLLKKEMTKHGIQPHRIAMMLGGRREMQTVELWLVPNGALSPRPTPARVQRGIVRR